MPTVLLIFLHCHIITLSGLLWPGARPPSISNPAEAVQRTEGEVPAEHKEATVLTATSAKARAEAFAEFVARLRRR